MSLGLQVLIVLTEKPPKPAACAFARKLRGREGREILTVKFSLLPNGVY